MTMVTEREWLTVTQFKERYRKQLGKNLIYDAVREGQLPSIKLGGKILIPSDALDQLYGRQILKR
jgi:excisionase family DNA binding protein